VWVCLRDAFFSIVAHRSEPELLLVRARRSGDIERHFPAAKVHRSPSADYAYRAYVPRSVVADRVAELAATIAYPNFKASVSDLDLRSAYSETWAILAGLQG
jgi:hypothetical protein